MITQKEIIYGAWTVLTTKGQNASCWMDESSIGESGTVNVRIIHSDSGEPALTEAIKGKTIHKSRGNNDMMFFEADNSNDIYYATCIDEGATVTLSVDAV